MAVRDLELRIGGVEEARVDLLAVCVRPGERLAGAAATADDWTGGALSRRLREDGFRAREGDAELLPVGDDGRPHVLAVGLGDPGDGNGKHSPEERLRRAAGRAVRMAREARAASVGFALPRGRAAPDVVRAAAEGLFLGDWSYDELRGQEARSELPPPPERIVVFATDGGPELEASARDGRLAAESQNFARELVARPANVATPRYLAARAEGVAEEFGLEVEVWGPRRLRDEGFGALLAVARGSDCEPRFVRLEYRGAEGAPFVLVGKGVTFDSGGISLKPSEGMEEMKYDMAGAAAVLGAVRVAAALELPLRVAALVPAAENLPSGSALKPSDVIRGVAGRSIEVVNTDAEGRLLLSDALAFAAGMNPRAVVDVATLTGGCVVALGHEAIGLMTPDDGLAEELRAAGELTGERVWRLPLWKAYRERLDSDIADIKNSGGRPASAVTAGWFLREFAGEAPWAHLDIAGTAWTEEDRPYHRKGATGIGVRLLAEWLRRAA